MSVYSTKTDLIAAQLATAGLNPGAVHKYFRWIVQKKQLQAECTVTDPDGKRRIRFAMIFKSQESVPAGGEVKNKTGGYYDKVVGDVFSIRFHLGLDDSENTEKDLNEKTEAIKNHFDTAACRAAFHAVNMFTSSLQGSTYGHVQYGGQLCNYIEMRITVFHQRQTGA